MIREPASGTVFIGIVGDFELAAASELRTIVANAKDAGVAHFTISMRDCDFCDSSGIAALVVAKKRFGAAMSLVVPRDTNTFRMLEITGLIGLLAPVESTGEAEAQRTPPP